MGEQNDFENQFGNCLDLRRAIGNPFLQGKRKATKPKKSKAAKVAEAKAAAFDAIVRMAEAGYGPTFTQKSIGVSYRCVDVGGDWVRAVMDLEGMK